MRPIPHAIISFGTSAFIYYWFQSLMAAVICFLAGVLLDIDHIPEYLAVDSKNKGIKDFYHSRLADDRPKVYLLLHSYELIFILWFIIQIFHLNLFWVAVAFSISVHLILDQLYNPIYCSYTYFLIYRVLKKFNSNELFLIKGKKQGS